MLSRSLTALVGLLILFIALWSGVLWVFLLVSLAAILGVREFYRLRPPDNPLPPRESPREGEGEVEQGPARPLSLYLYPGDKLHWVIRDQDPPARLQSSPGPRPAPLPFPLGAMWVIAFVIGGAAANGPLPFAAISLGLLICGGFVALLWLIAFYRGENWLAAAAYLVGGPVYVGFLLAHVLLLVQVGDSGGDSYGYELGRNWLLFALLATFATDTGAYLIGRTIGRHPLAPTISPNKTWEGAAGGFAGALIAAVLLDYFLALGLARETWNWQPPLIGATVGVAAQAGDLWESKLKRWAGVKDSGSLMPGHGGLLDRLDSLLVTIPVTYYPVYLAI